MLRLFFHFDGIILKVRKAREGEAFEHSVCWKNHIEFSLQDNTMMMMSWTSLLPDLKPRDAEALVDLASARYPLSHDYEELKRLCPDLVVGQKTDEWVFFGGSFNPWHEGHQACLNLLPTDLHCFVLPDRNPHKEMHSSEAVPTIIELSYKVKYGPHQFLVPTFLMLEKPNPTVDWIERIAEHYPEKKLSLLLGFDSLKNLLTWTRASDLIRKLACIYVCPRMEKDQERASVLAAIMKEHPTLEVLFLDHHPHESVSSTEIRRQRRMASPPK